MLAKKRPRLLLWGFMGTGKSTVGRLVAAARGVPFVDLDAMIETDVGMPLVELFAKEGEAAFREVEARILRTWLEREGPYLVALGGGALLDDELRREAKERTWVVALDAPAAVLAQRLQSEQTKRPLLSEPPGLTLEARIEDRLASRRPAYDDAHYKVDATKSLEAVVEAILRAWRPNASP